MSTAATVMAAIIPPTTPTPIPVFAPVESPESGCAEKEGAPLVG
jgi:hypothetical protein